MAEKDYIEREAIIRKLNEIGGCDASDEWDKVWDMAIDTAVKAVERLPVADAAPVRHGHWISLDDYFEDAQCSECGDALVIGDCSFNDFCECYKFCPNCGAKMDGGDENV